MTSIISCLTLFVLAQTPDEVAEMDLVELSKLRVSPFELSDTADRGYFVTNSLSGSKFDASTHQLPFALQAFNDTFIRDQKPVSLIDIARFSPGVTYRSNDFTEGNANLAIRGFAVSSAPGAVQVLRDGFHGPPIFDFTNVERVEIVKGPSSFLYGQVAPGGVVNVITRAPQRTFSARLGATVGSWEQYRLEGDVTGPLLDTVALRLTGSLSQDVHYWKPYDAHSWDLAASLRWQPLDVVSVSARFETFHKRETPLLLQKPGYSAQRGLTPTDEDPNRSGVDVPGLPDDWNTAALADWRDSDTVSFSTWLDLKPESHWNVRLAWSHLDSEIGMRFTGNLGMADNQTLLQGRRVREQTYTNRDDTLELQATGKYQVNRTSFRLLLGAQYVDRRFDNHAAQAPNDPALGTSPTASPLPLWDLADPSSWDRTAIVPAHLLTAEPRALHLTAVDRSLYGGVTIGFEEDRLLALAGWRLTSTESTLADELTGLSPHTASSAVTPQFGLLFQLTRGVALFGSWAQSFVPAQQRLNNADGTTSTALPTRGAGFDVGVKARLLDGRVTGSASVFDLENDDIVNDVAVTNALGVVNIFNVQSGRQRSTGFELDATVEPIRGWQLVASYAFTDARVVEFTGHDEALLAADPMRLSAAEQVNYRNAARFHGAPLQMSAPHLANFWTTWRPPEEWGLWHALSVSAGLNVVVNQTLLPDSPVEARQTYALVTARVAWEFVWQGRRATLELVGKNLADAHYRPSQSTRARPRELLFSVQVAF